MEYDARVLLIEPQKTPRENLFETLESLGYVVEVATDREEAIEQVDAFQPELVLSAHTIMDTDLADYLRLEAEVPASVVVIFPRGTKNPDRRAADLGADGAFCRPVARDTFLIVMRMAETIALARQDALALELRVDELGQRLERLGDVRPGQRFYHYEFFKHLLLVEIRRAKRYKYPLSVCLVELDPYRLPPGQLMARRDIRAGVARAVSESIRDIDIPVYVGGERILIVLPHTPVEGAKKVARRVSRLIREGMFAVGEEMQDITASIGVSGLDSKNRLTFSQLIREAQKGLDAARKKGGDAIVAQN